ncbi:MAG: acyl-ACP--UDP-N-acetylglucosamine O-acyltransferase [Calditrichaeota bacterium]|nr:acyl-ACP--UDP-N-acetylglucosamine O-acyltransferase [Calditrichota bacterium]
MATNIHPSAIIDPAAKIGNNVTIGPYSIIEKDVIIGDNCHIMSHVSILDGSRLENNVRIHQSAVIAGVPQDLKFKGEKTTVEIGEGSVIREFCTLNRGTEYRHKTVLGKGCFLMAYVHLAHDVVIGDKTIIANAVQIAGHVEIGSQSTVGGLVPIHQFVKIGDHAFIGGGFRCVKDVPPFVLAMGEPLVFGGVNIIGLQRKGFSEELIQNIKAAYKILYYKKLLRKDAIQAIKDSVPMSPEIENIITFVEAAERGLISTRK